MTKVKIRKGFDIKISGSAEKEIISLPDPKRVGVVPKDFRGIKPKLLVKEGDTVKAGSALFFDKMQAEIMFVSPVSGKVLMIEFGPRRTVLDIIIEADGKNEFESFKSWSKEELKSVELSDITSELQEAGLWPKIRQRPFAKTAKAHKKPKSIFISAMDTAPLAADPSFLIKDDMDLFQTGVDLLTRYTDGKVHIVVDNDDSTLKSIKNAEHHTFNGPHPAGNVGIHIHHIDPINRDEVVWYVAPQDLVAITKFLTSGQYPNRKTIAVAGIEAPERKYFNTLAGCPVSHLLKGISEDADLRYVSGDILMGSKREHKGFIGYYDNLLTVLEEGRERHFMGWVAPGFSALSFSKTFMSSIFPKKSYKGNTNMNGGRRAFVQTGLFEQVVPMDLYPDFLIKSILAEDIAEMEGLGIYEVSEEDFALCSYIDPSKNDVSGIIRQGLELIEKEG